MMNIFRTSKETLYTIREFGRSLFVYPKKYIFTEDAGVYDVYWQEKRGKKMGELSSWQKERADFIRGILKKERAPISLGDIGCGDGSILNYLKSSDIEVSECIGYDSSEVALQQARDFGIDTKQLNVLDTKTYNSLREVDYYLILETLEHVPNSEELLLVALSKARKGVFFSFPNTGYLRHRLRFLLGKFPLQWNVFPNEHVRFWTYTDLQWWLRALKLKSVRIYCYKGIPILNRAWPSLFAAAFIVYVENNSSEK